MDLYLCICFILEIGFVLKVGFVFVIAGPQEINVGNKRENPRFHPFLEIPFISFQIATLKNMQTFSLRSVFSPQQRLMMIMVMMMRMMMLVIVLQF